MTQTIFVVDGDFEVCRTAKHSLEAAGYAVRTFSTSAILLEVEAGRPSLLLLSPNLPYGNGLTLFQQLRANPLSAKTAVVFLVNAADRDRILALKSGVDGWIVKPFRGDELVAKVQAVLSRFASLSSVPAPVGATDLVIDSWAMKLSVRGVEVPVTTLEFRLIEYLARHRGQVFTRDLLLDAVWGDMQFVTPRSVDACILRIREKIELDRTKPTLLKTVRGVGYRMDAVAAWESAANERCDCIACTTRGRTRLDVGM